MKNRLIGSLVFAALAIGLTQTAQAADVNRAELPANLICAAPQAKVRSVRKFKITKLNGDEPESTFRMGFQDMSVDQGRIDVSFSDECEGWYAVSFSQADLSDLKSGKIQRITGELEYDDLAEFFPGLGNSDENGHDKTPIICKLAKTGA